MTDAVAVQLITSTATIVTLVVTWLLQRKQVRKVHAIVNSQRTEMLHKIDVLSGEVGRLNQDPDARTPTTRTASPPVTLRDGVVSAKPLPAAD